ncbi:hypothetical protein [Luteolibacter sp. Populi]|uniref:hypothetical protein n=1 Tax=Luteolibacter sp. Populi TaxID=3230487 RepID=UPI003466A38D
MNPDPPPLPPGYGEPIEMPPLPPGYGEREPEPTPPRRRRWRVRIGLWSAFILAGGLALYLGPLSIVVFFADDRGMVPLEFAATLRRGEAEKMVVVEEGRVRLLRFRWKEIEITDLSYLSEVLPLERDGQVFRIERNTSRKLKDAARGSPSIPQRGDPDPRND